MKVRKLQVSWYIPLQRKKLMSNYKITFTGNNLEGGCYTRHEEEPAVFPRDAVEAKPATYENGQLVTPAVEPKEAVAFKPAKYSYKWARWEFEFENNDDLKSGAEVFKAWLCNGVSEFVSHGLIYNDGIKSLSEMLNIKVNKESKAYRVSYTKKFTDIEITAEMAADYELDDEEAALDWLESNGDCELFEGGEDEGEMSDIEVEEIANEYIYVEWNG